tara:strand:- start:9 stop:527 length:519 start_codon:yes stop_codon:yes gene_type:complete
MATNLEFIKSVEVTSSVSSIDVDNVFTDKYDVYFVTITGFSTTSSTQTNLNLRFIDSTGSVETGSTYDYAGLALNSQSAFGEAKSTSATSIEFAPFDLTPENGNLAFYIYNPFDSSSFTFLNYQMASSRAVHFLGHKGIGVEHTAQLHRGFQMLEVLSRPFDEGKISVYGVK